MRRSMKSTVIIPARMDSRRLSGKALADLGGRPMVVRVAQQAQKCPAVAQVVVATDSPDIACVAQAYDIETLRTGSHHTSGTDRVYEAAKRLNLESVLNVQGDEPFIHPRDLLVLARSLAEGPWPMVTLSAAIKDPELFQAPHAVKVVCDDAGRALYFSRAPIPYTRSDVGDGVLGAQHVGVYGYRMETLREICALGEHELERREGLEQLRALAGGIPIGVLPIKNPSRGIDTQEDLDWAREEIARLGDAAFADL